MNKRTNPEGLRPGDAAFHEVYGAGTTYRNAGGFLAVAYADPMDGTLVVSHLDGWTRTIAGELPKWAAFRLTYPDAGQAHPVDLQVGGALSNFPQDAVANTIGQVLLRLSGRFLSARTDGEG